MYLEVLHGILGGSCSVADILRLDLLRVRHEDVLQPLDDGRAHRVVSIQSWEKAWFASVCV